MKYNANQIETYWQKKWEINKKFLSNLSSVPFSIMIPPPNVNGKLHIGHAFEYTLIDSIIRYKYMQGYITLLQFGTDHAGIAIQLLMDNKLSNNKISRSTLGRKLFLKNTLRWCKNTIPTIILQMKRIGISVDWKNERFTMDYGFYQAVQEAFINFYKEGLIYRGKRLINWDPKFFTALSDIEVENINSKGMMWYVRYPLFNHIEDEEFCKGQGPYKNFLIIATTRPETILADTCIAVNPYDKRYKKLIGKCVISPLFGRILPIISDEFVDKHFGTGCVKITPAHNFIDYKIGKRNNSLLINIFTTDFKILKKAEICKFKSGKILHFNFLKLPKTYVGMSIKILRLKIVKDLFKNKFLVKQIDNYMLMLPCGDRSGAVIEPLLTDQWFVSIKNLAKFAINAVKNGNIKFIPKNYEKIYINWMYNIKDWCISRQLWWGHRIPAWFDENNNIFVGRNEDEIRNKYSLPLQTKLHQDKDVLDTWFSSGLWIFTTIGWPQQNRKFFNLFHPSSILITGFDIIPFWVSRLIMMTLNFINEIPFKNIFIHGLIRDIKGQKMSKSKGNVIDPIEVIDGIAFFGADALRYSLLSISLPGKDIKFDLGRLKCYRNFCNKLWNATKYVISKASIFYKNEYSIFFIWENLNSINKFIISRLQKTKNQLLNYLDEYRLDLASQIIYEFVWYEFCDWYLEFSKLILNSKFILHKFGTINTLLYVLKEILLLLHPLIPYITEELWKNIMLVLYKNKKTIILNQSWPNIEKNKIDKDAIFDVEFLKNLIINIRYMRTSLNVNNFKFIKVYCSKVKLFYKDLLNNYNNYICNLANIKILNYFEPNIPCLSKTITNIMVIHIPIIKYYEFTFFIEELKKQKILIKLLEAQFKTNNLYLTKKKAHQFVITKNKIKLKKAKDFIKFVSKT
ncbi:Valine--tRNA ligase [Candidatus Portiera aleyrodidarum]|uniref:Valine--tRNA ligase n=1 Tax=Candidatus Portiera aleyrodidarum TaxID=91844 RepID=A0A6S6S4J0_9GAMM|nr:valine--tRNA ligase [Candidatus Portiera aleyrodidarum]CAA3706779.1 Valine--tRNA ligase [Candidatus Portiera aleyrodidarum]